MVQHTDELSPSPDLIGMIKRLHYKEGWAFNYLEPFRFRIDIKCTDSTGRHESNRLVPGKSFSMDWRDTTDTIKFRDVDRPFVVQHTFVIPPEAVMFSEADMRRWLLDRIVDVETHEACEFFALESKTYPGSYFKPFFPTHRRFRYRTSISDYRSDTRVMDFMYLANDYKQVLVWLCYAIPGNTKLHVWYVDDERNTAYVDDVGLAGLVNDF